MVRRGKGEGSITQRTDGSWQGALQVDGRRRWVTGKTEKEVKAKLADLQREAHQNGALSEPGTKTLNDLLDLWLKKAGPTLKPRTVHDHECQAICPSGDPQPSPSVSTATNWPARTGRRRRAWAG